MPLEKNVNCLNVLIISNNCETSRNHLVSSLYIYQDKKLHINVIGSSSIWECWSLNICLDFFHCAPGVVDKYFIYSRTASAGKKQQQICTFNIQNLTFTNGWAAEDTNIEFNLWVGYDIRNILILVIPWNNCLLELFATWIVLFSMLLMVWTSPIPMEP
jgi:hypothetical protein